MSIRIIRHLFEADDIFIHRSGYIPTGSSGCFFEADDIPQEAVDTSMKQTTFPREAVDTSTKQTTFPQEAVDTSLKQTSPVSVYN